MASSNSVSTVINTAYANDKKSHGNSENEKEDSEELWEEIHELSSNFTLILIFLHIAGVYLSTRLHNENLVKAMITGKKKI